MKPGLLWKISVSTSAEAEEAVLELLQRHFRGSPAVYLDSITGKTTAGLYLHHLPTTVSEELARIKEGLQAIRRCGLSIGPGRVTLSRVPPENWAESWKRHFRPFSAGKALLIRPSWSKRRPGPDQAVVELDPGLSFGTGHHPTTRFCLQELVRWRPRRQSTSFLDVGTGSGILAIAAAKLGFRVVEAFDVDPAAIRIARENVVRNRVSSLVRIVRRDLGQWRSAARRRFDLICANLSEDLLLAHREVILNRLAARGRLVLAGIPTVRFSRVERAYREAGLVLIRSGGTREWCSGTFSFKALRVLR
jgi:ribosomal protein L11 methyltransferase